MGEKEEQLRLLKELKEDYRKVFLSSRAGKRVLQDLIEYAGVFLPSMTGNSQTFFNEGKRDVGLRILTALDRRSYAAIEVLESEGLTFTEIFPKGDEQ